MTRPADPDRTCAHAEFAAVVNLIRLARESGEIEGFTAEVTVSCVGCGESFRWTGCEPGFSPERPMVSVDGRQLRAPLRPASSDPDFGLGVPGFTVRWTGP